MLRQLSFALLLAVTSIAHAADPAPAAQAAARAEVASGKGTIVSIDAAAGSVSMKHEAIAALKWPAMTMDFALADKKLAAGLKAGQVVVFGLVKDPAGGYAISRIAPAK